MLGGEHPEVGCKPWGWWQRGVLVLWYFFWGKPCRVSITVLGNPKHRRVAAPRVEPCREAPVPIPCAILSGSLSPTAPPLLAPCPKAAHCIPPGWVPLPRGAEEGEHPGPPPPPGPASRSKFAFRVNFPKCDNRFSFPARICRAPVISLRVGSSPNGHARAAGEVRAG